MVSHDHLSLMRLPTCGLISLAALLQPAAEQQRVDDVIRYAQEASRTAIATPNALPDRPQDQPSTDEQGSPDDAWPSLGPQPNIAWDRGAAAVAYSLELRSLPTWQPESLLRLSHTTHASIRQDDVGDLLDVNGHNANHLPHGPPSPRA